MTAETTTPNERFHHMSVTHHLPCGHTLEHGIRVPVGSDTPHEWMARASEMLAYWVRTRAEMHVCDLVTPENPTGRGPRKDVECFAAFRDVKTDEDKRAWATKYPKDVRDAQFAEKAWADTFYVLPSALKPGTKAKILALMREDIVKRELPVAA